MRKTLATLLLLGSLLLAGCSGSADPPAEHPPGHTGDDAAPPADEDASSIDNVTVDGNATRMRNETLATVPDFLLTQATPVFADLDIPAGARELVVQMAMQPGVFSTLTYTVEGCDVVSSTGVQVTNGDSTTMVCEVPPEGANRLGVSVEAGAIRGSLTVTVLVPADA